MRVGKLLLKLLLLQLLRLGLHLGGILLVLLLLELLLLELRLLIHGLLGRGRDRSLKGLLGTISLLLNLWGLCPLGLLNLLLLLLELQMLLVLLEFGDFLLHLNQLLLPLRVLGRCGRIMQLLWVREEPLVGHSQLLVLLSDLHQHGGHSIQIWDLRSPYRR